MPTMNLLCTKAEWWDYWGGSWTNVALGTTTNIRTGYVPSIGIPSGMQLFSFQNVPSGITIVSAIARFNAIDDAVGYNTINSRVSGTYRAWSSNAPSAPLITTNFNSTPASFAYSIDITTQLQNYVGAGNVPYLYKYYPSDASGSWVWDQLNTNNAPYIELTYSYPYSSCTFPTTFTVSTDVPQYNVTVTFNWSGAVEGGSNPITAYKIFYDSANNGSYSTLLTTISTSATSGSYSFTPNYALNTTRYYKIQTIGTVTGYDSVLSTTYVSITVKSPRISYYNGAWGEYEVYIYNGTTWQTCQIFGYDTAWRECHT